MFHVYVIKSGKDGRLYKGMTKNVNNRLQMHNAGKVTATKGFRPWILVYSEAYPTLIDAREREKQLKSGIGREFLKSIKL